MRPTELATDNSPGIASVMHALDCLPSVSDLLLLQPTSPLRQLSNINDIVALHREDRHHAFVSMCVNSKHPAWMFELSPDKILQPLTNLHPISCRQQLPPVYTLNGALYIASRSFLQRERSFLTEHTKGYVMSPEHSIDIDTMLEWRFAEFLMQSQNKVHY